MTAKTYRVDEEIAKKIREIWRSGIDIEEDLKESEIVNYALMKVLPSLDIDEVIKNRKRRWSREKNQEGDA